MCLFQGIRIRVLTPQPLHDSWHSDVIQISFQAIEYDGRFFVNPGSATGAWTGSYNGYSPCIISSALPD